MTEPKGRYLARPFCAPCLEDKCWICEGTQDVPCDCIHPPLESDAERDVQCRRCGSSMMWVACYLCGNEGWFECDDPTQCCDGLHPCSACTGQGGEYVCLSDDRNQWCERHPRPGCEDVPPSTEEWFEVPA